MEKTKQGQVGMGQRSLAQETWRRFKRNRLAIAGMVFIGVLLAISVITVILDLVNPELYNDLVVKNDLLNKQAEPSPEHILRCDEYGRDLLFRILWAPDTLCSPAWSPSWRRSWWAGPSAPSPGTMGRSWTTASCGSWI